MAVDGRAWRFDGEMLFDKEMIEGNVDVGQRVEKPVGDGENVDEDKKMVEGNIFMREFGELSF